MRELWPQLHELFYTDDGSLPDLFIENLTADQVRIIYGWIRSQCEVYCGNGAPTLWDCIQECDVVITSLDDPAQLVISGHAEPFRHGLTKFSVSGVELPPMSVALSPNQIEFNYRMGSEWRPSQVVALFDLLWTVQSMAPDAMISHAHEGDSQRSPSFTNVWREFKFNKMPHNPS